jgi:hypothetical protein
VTENVVRTVVRRILMVSVISEVADFISSGRALHHSPHPFRAFVFKDLPGVMISAIATPILRVAYTKDKSAFYLIVPLNSCLSAARTHPWAHRAALGGQDEEPRKHPAMQRIMEASG